MATTRKNAPKPVHPEIIQHFCTMAKLRELIPNLLTAGNLLGGVLAILFALTGRLEWAPYCIFISAILDFFDGFVARLLKVQSELGKQLDSLADMVTFGVAPGVMVFMMMKMGIMFQVFSVIWHDNSFAMGENSYFYLPQNGFTQFQNAALNFDLFATGMPAEQLGLIYEVLPYAAFIIPVMSMFRLAKFNLDPRQSDSFIGLPTPANTLFFAALVLLFANAFNQGPSGNDVYLMTFISNPWFLLCGSLILSVLLVAELPLFALKFKSFGWKGNGVRYSFLTLAVVLLATLHWLAIPILIILYILLSVIQNLVKK